MPGSKRNFLRLRRSRSLLKCDLELSGRLMTAIDYTKERRMDFTFKDWIALAVSSILASYLATSLPKRDIHGGTA